MKVLVTGGAGYIGSVAAEMLIEAGHAVVVLDNLSRGHRAAVPPEATLRIGDIRLQQEVAGLLRSEKVDCVMHFAASSLVGESMEHPGDYFDNNVIGILRLLEAMRETGIDRIIFSSTAATYGEPRQIPIRESDPVEPTNPYGESKAISERILSWYRRVHRFRYASLRYFNAAGASEAHGEDHAPETHLIPLALEAAAGRRSHLGIFGDDYGTPDGTCIRDYIHVCDLADAHIRALELLEQLDGKDEAVFNLGNGEGYSVREVVAAVERVTDHEVPVRNLPRRPGDPARLVASAERARAVLGWRPRRTTLDQIVGDAWSWMQRHPDGYES
ncbi:MAG: UDP-glucose 4-epimerase GalE [Candidatus Eisenbacteria bacterium]|nr:UDP-glucose 4-epimerase GalE [Candidatus Eisenbacteria bacterium]